MSFNLNYGLQLNSNFSDVAEAIIKDVKSGERFAIGIKLNEIFFGGPQLAPKSFEKLFSNTVPETSFRQKNSDGVRYIYLSKETRFGVRAFLEAIPLIGSAIAAINTLYHVYGMLSSYSALKKEVKEIEEWEENSEGRDLRLESVFNRAIDYTVHQNHLFGSLLSLIPFVKPIVRIAQGVIFNARSANNNSIPSHA